MSNFFDQTMFSNGEISEILYNAKEEQELFDETTHSYAQVSEMMFYALQGAKNAR